MTNIRITTPEAGPTSIPVRTGVREADLFAGETQFPLREVSEPADINAALDTFSDNPDTEAEPIPNAADDEVIGDDIPLASETEDHEPIVYTPRAKRLARFGGVVAITALIAAVGLTTASENKDKTSYQNAINQRADSK